MVGKSFKSVWGILLTLLLVVTGQSMALSRGAAAATGEMVICVGADTKTIYVDINGNPISPPHLCPDCLLAFAGAASFQPPVFDARWSTAAKNVWTPSMFARASFDGFLSRAPPNAA